MRNIYFKSEIGNFGDDLNGWLWPRLFKGFEKGDDLSFIGIGSILDARFNSHEAVRSSKRKIVFGTGVRPSLTGAPLSLDAGWDIRFLRGPLSSTVYQNAYPYITDAAYAVRQVSRFSQISSVPKKYKVSLMPYFRSLNYLDWEQLCAELGYHYISPLAEKGVEHTLEEIAASERVLTEAMHGAIVADLFRVPWKRFALSTYEFESPFVAEFKWRDWLESVGITNPSPTIHLPLYMGNRITQLVRKFSSNRINVNFFRKEATRELLTQQLSVGASSGFNLSTDSKIGEVDEKISREVDYVNKLLDRI